MKSAYTIFISILAVVVIGVSLFVFFQSAPPEKDVAQEPVKTRTEVIEPNPQKEEGEKRNADSVAEPARETADSIRSETTAPVAKVEKGETSISGVVRDSRGNPLGQVKVELMLLVREFMIPGTKSGFDATTTTHSDGSFLFSNVSLKSTQKDTQFARLHFTLDSYAEKFAEGLALQPGKKNGMEPVVLYREAKISGRVQARNSAGLENGLIKASSTEKGPRFTMAAPTQLAGRGDYLIRNLNPGSYRVVSKAKGCQKAVSEEIQVAEGEERQGVNLVLEEGLTIRGQVRSAEGKAIANAQLTAIKGFQSLHEDVNDVGIFDPQFNSEKTTSDAQGQYLISGLSVGEYDIRAKAAGYSTTSKNRIKAGTESVDIVLGNQGVIVGKVVDAVTGAGIAGCKVQAKKALDVSMPIVMGGKTPKAESTADGSFRIEGIDPGNYSLSLEKEDYAPGSQSGFQVTSSQETSIGSISLSRGASLRVQVSAGATKEKLKGATVKVESASAQRGPFIMLGDIESDIAMPGMESSSKKSSKSTDEKGEVVFKNLKPGSYKISATHPTQAENSQTFEVLDGAENTFELELHTGASICGTVFHADGSVYANATISLDDEEYERRMTRSDQDGKYCFSNLRGGEYWLNLDTDSFGGMRFRTRARLGDSRGQEPEDIEEEPREGFAVAVGDGAQVSYDLHEPRKGTLKGRVMQAGSPVSKATIQVAIARERLMPVGMSFGQDNSAVSDENGNYEIPKLVPGKYFVRVGKAQAVIPFDLQQEISLGNNSLDISLPGGVLEGRVVDETNGNALKGLSVSLDKDDGEGAAHPEGLTLNLAFSSDEGGEAQIIEAGTSVKTDGEGRFKLQDIPAGKYRIRVRGNATYAEGKLSDITLAENERKTGLELKLQAGGSIKGKVLDAAGNPAGMTLLLLTTPQGKTVKSTPTSLDGSFKMEGVPPGSYILAGTSMHEQGSSAQINVTVKAKESTECELRLKDKN